jgi:ankyrin repeat protein
MSQADIDSFVLYARMGLLTPERVTTAVVDRGIPVNGQESEFGWTALQWAVMNQRREVVVALLAAGADANVRQKVCGFTPVLVAALYSTADILQLLIDSGGSVNKPNYYDSTPLMELVRNINGDVVARLQVLFACPELDLDAKCQGKTAEEWAVQKEHFGCAAAIAEERRRRMLWSTLRWTWIAAINRTGLST